MFLSKAVVLPLDIIVGIEKAALPPAGDLLRLLLGGVSWHGDKHHERLALLRHLQYALGLARVYLREIYGCSGKKSACQCRRCKRCGFDLDWKIPGTGDGNTLHYSCLGYPIDRRPFQARVHGLWRVRYNWTTEYLTTYCPVYSVPHTPHTLVPLPRSCILCKDCIGVTLIQLHIWVIYFITWFSAH